MNTTNLMKAIVINAYGSPDVVELKEVARPAIKDDEVLVRVHAASLNAGDVFALRGSPWLIRLSVGLPQTKELHSRLGHGRARRGRRQPGDALQTG